MAGTVKFVPPRVPLVDLRSGQITREWYLLFASLFEGGDSSSGIPDPTDDTPLVVFSPVDDRPGALAQEIVMLPDQSMAPQIEALARAAAILPPVPDYHERLDALELAIAGLGPTQAGIASRVGSYTPTITNVVNVTATTAHVLDFTQVGNRCIVSGRADIQATAAGIAAVQLSLPVATNFTSDDQAGGAGAMNVQPNGSIAILSDAASDSVQLNFLSPGAGNYGCTFIFQYRII